MHAPIEVHRHEYEGVYDPHHPMSRTCTTLISSVEALRGRFTATQRALESTRVVAEAQWAAARAASNAEAPPPPLSRTNRHAYAAPLAKQPDYVHALNELREIEAAERDFPGHMVVSLMSAWDTFKGELMRAAFDLRPELLDASRRELVYGEIAALTRDEIRGLVVEREVDRLLHGSQKEQSETLRARLNIPPEVAAEVGKLHELSERRNLYAHLGGRVSAWYVKTCCPDLDAAPTPGSHLETDHSYFQDACDAVIETAVRLAQGTWRSLSTIETLGQADRDLAQLTYTLIVLRRFKIAQTLLAHTTKSAFRASSEQHRLVFVINLAQTFKWQGNQQACESVLRHVEWASKDTALQLAEAVLLDDYSAAAELMIAAGHSHQVQRSAFDHWPLFDEFRQTPQYVESYRVLYDADPDPTSRCMRSPTAGRID